MEFLNSTFLNKDSERLSNKIGKVNDYLNDNPGGYNKKIIDSFKIIVNFLKKLKDLKNLDVFFDEKKGNPI